MAEKKILYICQEIYPYIPEGQFAVQCRELLQSIGEYGAQIRSFMPRYGIINERRNQLHEVIRLSGMNLIIDDNDHQLILKVASIPSARIQIYFIDNDDYFSRKAMMYDGEGEPFEDNDERAIFFARGVLETVKKLRWTPDIVHIHGWLSCVAPIYLKHSFADDPIFKDAKIVVSIYNDTFPKALNADFRKKIESEGVVDEDLTLLDDPTYQNLYRFVLKYADGVIIASEDVDSEVKEYARENCKNFLDYTSPESEDYYKNYNSFYDSL